MGCGASIHAEELPEEPSSSEPPLTLSEQMAALSARNVLTTYAEPDRERSRRGVPVRETSTLAMEQAKHGLMTFVNQYIIIKTLGEGTYGKVKLAMNTQDQQLYAVKIVEKLKLKRHALARGGGGAGETPSGVLREVSILKMMDHVNITNLIEVIDPPKGQYLYMVLEYVDGGSIKPPAQGFDELQVRSILRAVCKGLDYLHWHHVVHRDLKPANLLKSKGRGEVKLADFGVSETFALEDNFRDTAGTPAFMAPEMCDGTPYHGIPTDLWALGVTLFNLFYGSMPFTADGIPELYRAIQTQEVVFPEHKPISSELQALILGLLTKDHAQRMTLPQVIAHPFTTRYGETPLRGMRASPAVSPTSSLKSATAASPAASPLRFPERPVSPGAEAVAAAINNDPREVLLEATVCHRQYVPGDFLIRKGEMGHEMYFIEKGTVEVLMLPAEAPPLPDTDSDSDSDDSVFGKNNEKMLVNNMTSLNFLSPLRRIKSKSETSIFRSASFSSHSSRETRETPSRNTSAAVERSSPSRTSTMSPTRRIRLPSFTSSTDSQQKHHAHLTKDTRSRLRQKTAVKELFLGEWTDVAYEVVTTRTAGEVVGEMAVVTPHCQRTAYVRAVDEVSVLVISKEQWQILRETHPNAVDNLVRTAANRATETLVHELQRTYWRLCSDNTRTRIEKRGPQPPDALNPESSPQHNST